MTFQQLSSICVSIYASAAFIAADSVTAPLILALLWMVGGMVVSYIERKRERAA